MCISLFQENVDQMPAGLMLIGNKQDLDEVNEREVSTETGETFAKVAPPSPLPSLWRPLSIVLSLQIYSAQFMETSAKTGFNVGNCLMNLVRYDVTCMASKTMDGPHTLKMRSPVLNCDPIPYCHSIQNN